MSDEGNIKMKNARLFLLLEDACWASKRCDCVCCLPLYLFLYRVEWSQNVFLFPLSRRVLLKTRKRMVVDWWNGFQLPIDEADDDVVVVITKRRPLNDVTRWSFS